MMAPTCVSIGWAAVALLTSLLATSLALHPCPRSCNCPGPREVHCTFRHLLSIPPSLPEDTERINLGYNSIQLVGASDFTKLPRVEMLMLHGNDIVSVSSGAFYNLRSLQMLKLSYNKLKRLDPGMFWGLSGLVRLHLDHNAIETIEPLSFSGLTSLKLLQLEANRLRELHPHTFITVSFLGTFWGSGLRHLHLSDNQLEFLLPETLQHLNKLEVLSLHGNPWACDCHLHWLVEWHSRNEGVIKCKKERSSSLSESCAICRTPQHLNGSHIFQLSASQLPCEKPMVQSPLKLRDVAAWEDSEPDLPYTKDLEPPLGQLTFVLSDSHENRAHVSCAVKRPSEASTVAWENLKMPGWVAVNVTLASQLECEIDRDELQNLWKLVAYYYESPAILERGLRQENTSRTTFQYSQMANEDSPYFTELKGHLMAEPAWLLQPRVTLQLNRRRTTTKKLVLNFSTFISKHISGQEDKGADMYTWAMVQRGTPGRLQAVLEGSDVNLECKVISSGRKTVQWMLPDLSILNTSHDRLEASEDGVLVIKSASMSDSGLYHCLVQTSSDVDVVSFRLTVRELLLSPDSMNGQAMSVESEGTLTLPCSVSSVQPSKISWFLPGNQILHPSPRHDRVYVATNGTLVIKRAAQEDAGEYSCLASNLYGADMLSHRVTIMGDKDTESQSAEQLTGSAPVKNVKFPTEDSEDEGSGFWTTGRLIPTPAPRRTIGKPHGSGRSFSQVNRGVNFKEGKRKLNKSVKELDPNRWAQIIAKAHAKGSTSTQSTSVASAAETMTATSKMSTATTPTPTTTTSTTLTPTLSTTTTTIASAITTAGRESTSDEFTTTIPTYFDRDSNIPKPTLLNSNSVDITYNGSSHVTLSNQQPVAQPEQSMDQRPTVGGAKSSSNSFTGNRRRLPYRRRRPPQRKIQPINLNPSKGKVESSQQVPSNTTRNSDRTDKYRKHENNATLPRASITVDSSNEQVNLPSDHQLPPITEESAHSELLTPTVGSLQRIHQSVTGNTAISTTVSGYMPYITAERNQRKEAESTMVSSEKDNNEFTWKTTTEPMSIRFNSPVNIKPPSMQDRVSASPATTHIVPLMEQKGLSNKSNPAMANKWKDSRNTGSPWDKDSTISKSKTHHPPAAPVDHPWSRQQHVHKKVNVPNTQPPSTSTFSWAHWAQFTSWPPVYNSRLYPSSVHRPWNSLHPVGRDDGVTNRPGITAQTVKPTVFPSESGPAQTSRPFISSSTSRTRDYWLSRFRNRHKQSQLDVHRLSQLGKIITPKPRVSSPTPKPFEAPVTPRSHSTAAPTPFPSHTNRPHHTASVLYGSRWHYHHGGPRILSTALPFPQLMGSGVKPRITSANVVSVSALAESDVVLPCESKGDPKPMVSWTKVSTGATIQEDTKHGQRFEVLRNGTFVIQNVQLQDRGQYLCTAQNKFGSDRMVVTLAVLTQPPKITAPASKDVSVYLGRPVSLDCVAGGRPKAQISWLLPDRTFVREESPSDAAATLLLANGTLMIPAANFSSKGDYKCIASNAAGADTVTYRVHVAALPPVIKEEASENIKMKEGWNVYMHCTAKGEPLPFLKWTIPSGEHIKPSQFLDGRLFVFPNGTLYVRSSLPTDSGKYECYATNAVGSSKRAVQLDIRQEPSSPRHSPSQPHRVTAMYGSTVYLHCPESMSSQRGALWRLPSKTQLDHRYSPERPVTAFPNGTLRIQQLTDRDAGTYYCIFQRPNGEEMELFLVEVLMKPPKIEHLGTAAKKVVYGANFQVDCVASGLPDPEVSWTLPDGTMISNALQSDDSGTRSRRYIIFGNGTLLLQQMGKGDEGDYTCYAKNELGEDEMKVSIKVVQDSPKILSKDQGSHWGQLGKPTYLKCEARGDPPPTIIWISPRNDIIGSLSPKYQILDDGTLVIKQVGLDDRGKYACLARNSAGDDIKNVRLEVEAKKPHINGKGGQTSMNILAVSYQTQLLDCKAEGMPEPAIIWTTSRGISLPAPYQGGRFQVHQNGSLELRGLRKTDEGRFTCLAKNDMGEASLQIDLEVASLAEKPSFAIPNIEVLPLKADGKDIVLKCLARGKPVPEYVWVLPNGTVLIPGTRLQRFLHYQGNGTLRILQSTTTDKGVYRCLAKNVAGQAEKRYSLEPGKKPQVRGTSGPVKISFGQNLNLPCAIDAWPQATISWHLPSGLMLNKPQVIGRVTVLSNGTFILRDITTFDRGTYTCKATNMFGSSTISYPVAVTVYPPRITSAPPSIMRVNRGSSVILNCIAVGTPKPDISWTLPGRTTLVPSNRFAAQGSIHMTVEGSLVIQKPVLMNSGIYKCNAKNSLGTDFKATYLQVI
nr:matrix-remodeling-associated protein 5-like [Paramormyrops kingsleyae]XP_023675672.1 matrix-remodeling-associated protein 5-like [Paramormyrops kingsleyae]